MKTHKPKLQTLKPRIKEVDWLKARGIKTIEQHSRTLKEKQKANGRTLALNGAPWRRLRALVIAEQPLCAQCQREGRITVGSEVDHRDNDAANNERSNLENLCHTCHSRKTNADMGHKVAYGCDANGRPLDPNHHWNAAQKAAESPVTDCHEPTVSLNTRIRSL